MAKPNNIDILIGRKMLKKLDYNVDQYSEKYDMSCLPRGTDDCS